jgi:hypothetical protein
MLFPLDDTVGGLELEDASEATDGIMDTLADTTVIPSQLGGKMTWSSPLVTGSKTEILSPQNH